MTVRYYEVNFRVLMPDSLLPQPQPDEFGFLWYTPTVILDSRDDLDTLIGYASTMDLQPADGGRGNGVATIRGGIGSRHLVYPEAVDADGFLERTYRAVLTEVTDAMAYGFSGGKYQATCTWFLVEEVEDA